MPDDQNFVQEQILKSIYTLSPRQTGRSIIWTILTEIIKDDGTVHKGYLYCRKCLHVVKYLPKQMSNLTRHKCCQTLRDTKGLKIVTADEKKAAIDACEAWITEDCQPFSAISGSGFIKLAKFLISIGAKHGENVDVEDLLPDTTSIYRAVQKLAEEKRKQIKEEIADVVHSGGASATIELWTDNYVHRNFLGVTLHYQKNFQLYDIVLGMKSMDFERSTAPDIFSKLSTLFCEFGINNMEEIKFITDRQSKVVKSLEDNIRLNCSSHLFANALEYSFKETAELTELVEACKKVVKFFKKANLQHHLAYYLENECPTRWNSNFTMFKSIVDNWYQINELLRENHESQMLLPISISTLRQLVELCADFQTVFKKLQLCSSPSLCFVIPSIRKVKHLCMTKDTDDAVILIFKEKIINNVDKYWTANLSLWQKTALFLYPPALNMQPTDLSDIKNFCLSLIDDNLDKITYKSPSSPSVPASPAYSDSVSQCSFADNNLTMDFESSESANQSETKEDISFFFPGLFKKPKLSSSMKSPSEELDRYCREYVDISDDFDVLKWWKTNEKYYPYLSKLAMQVHSIPASTAAAERAFSLAGNVISEKRNRVGPKSVDSILFLHSYFKNFGN